MSLQVEHSAAVGYPPWLVMPSNPAVPSPREEDERALMERYAGGDAEAFHALYKSISPRLFGYLSGLLGERVAAEDVLQLTFIRLHEARDQYVRGADPAPWIFTIGHRLALDELRRRKRARVRLAAESPPEAHAELDGSQEGSAEQPDERIAVTLALLQQLPESQRTAILLTKVEGRSLAEAAEITGATVSAIKLRAHRAYVTLRKLLGKGAR
jgi:RNA polymerase sigma-70 factor (ECF subfamily)